MVRADVTGRLPRAECVAPASKSVGTQPRFPSASTVSPTKRPGTILQHLARTLCTRTARYPGPPPSCGGIPSGLSFAGSVMSAPRSTRRVDHARAPRVSAVAVTQKRFVLSVRNRGDAREDPPRRRTRLDTRPRRMPRRHCSAASSAAVCRSQPSTPKPTFGVVRARNPGQIRLDGFAILGMQRP